MLRREPEGCAFPQPPADPRRLFFESVLELSPQACRLGGDPRHGRSRGVFCLEIQESFFRPLPPRQQRNHGVIGGIDLRGNLLNHLRIGRGVSRDQERRTDRPKQTGQVRARSLEFHGVHD